MVYTWIFEASGSARQTVLKLYKVFSNYIFWSCLLAQKKGTKQERVDALSFFSHLKIENISTKQP